MVNLSKIGKGKSITYHPPKSVIDEQVAELLGIHTGVTVMYHVEFGVSAVTFRMKNLLST